MSDPKILTPGLWWRDDMAEPARITEATAWPAPGLWWQKPGMRGPSRAVNDGHWIAPVLTVEQADAIAQRAERAEKIAAMVDVLARNIEVVDPDPVSRAVAAVATACQYAQDRIRYAAERDEELERAERAEHTLAMVREAANALEWIGWRDLDSRSTDEARGMNTAGWRLRTILDGGDND